jgi:oligopeptidase A
VGRVTPHDAHVDTGAQLPRELFDKMVAAKNFQAGMQTVRQIEFSLFDMRLHVFDMRLHGDFDPNGSKLLQKSRPIAC